MALQGVLVLNISAVKFRIIVYAIAFAYAVIFCAQYVRYYYLSGSFFNNYLDTLTFLSGASLVVGFFIHMTIRSISMAIFCSLILISSISSIFEEGIYPSDLSSLLTAPIFWLFCFLTIISSAGVLVAVSDLCPRLDRNQ